MSYSPYGVMKRVGELYTKSLGGLIVHFWNVYGIEKDMEKAHVITDFIRKGFETGVIDMMTDGTEERQFLYAEDCCKALKIIMKKYDEFKSDDPLHITSFRNNSILEVAETIQDVFKEHGMNHIEISPSKLKDSVQMDKKNKPDTYILDWWQPKTTLMSGITKVFEAMKNDWV
jgi:nucleoside-diphosphate-sugar epimerase